MKIKIFVIKKPIVVFLIIIAVVVVVTHDPNIADYSEQIINIRDGQIILNHSEKEKVLWKK